MKWRPFSKEKYCIIRLEYPLYAHFAAEYAKQRQMYPLMILQYQSELKNRNLCGENIWEIVFRQKKIQDIKNRNATILVSKVEPFGEMYLSRTCIDINNNFTDKNTCERRKLEKLL